MSRIHESETWKKDEEPMEYTVASYTYTSSEDVTPYLYVAKHLPTGKFGVYLESDAGEIEIDRCKTESSAIRAAEEFLARDPIGGSPKKVTRKLDSKGRVSLKEFANPEDEVQIAFLGKEY